MLAEGLNVVGTVVSQTEDIINLWVLRNDLEDTNQKVPFLKLFPKGEERLLTLHSVWVLPDGLTPCSSHHTVFPKPKETSLLDTIRTTCHSGTMWFSFCLELSLLFWSLIFYSPSLGLNKRSRQEEPQLFKGRSLFRVKASMFDTAPW